MRIGPVSSSACPFMTSSLFLRAALAGGVAVYALLLSGCATPPGGRLSAQNQREVGAFTAKKYGTASPRVASGGDIPSGGGNYLVGRPYRIAGHTYYPSEKHEGYTVTGMSSWYGDAFHGRRTANGEIYNKNALSAAHPTMPLPSYARVTNLRNNYSVVVRVNDRGPYHGGRVLDVSERVADALDFKGQGTTRIKVDYVGRAPLEGSSDRQLLATLRTDGAPAILDGYSAPAPVLTASRPLDKVGTNAQADAPAPVPVARPVVAAAPRPGAPRPAPEPDHAPAAAETGVPAETIAAFTELPKAPARKQPTPPPRPYDLATVPGAGLPISAYAPKPPAVANAAALTPLPPAALKRKPVPLLEDGAPADAQAGQTSGVYFAPAPIAVQFQRSNPFGAIKH